MLQDSNLGDAMLGKISTNTKPLTPVLPEERIVVLDVLRGFALFGILVMNMWWFTLPASWWALEPRGGKLVPLYLRRLLVLFLIGATHAILLWHGDVLHMYAVLGLLLLALRRASDRTIFVLIGIFLVAPFVRSGWALYHSELPPHSL